MKNFKEMLDKDLDRTFYKTELLQKVIIRNLRNCKEYALTE